MWERPAAMCVNVGKARVGRFPTAKAAHAVRSDAAALWSRLTPCRREAVTATIAVDTGFKYMSVAPYHVLGA